MRISDWSSDVCSSDLSRAGRLGGHVRTGVAVAGVVALALGGLAVALAHLVLLDSCLSECRSRRARGHGFYHARRRCLRPEPRSEEHTSELQSLMRISYAVFCLKKKKHPQNYITNELK